MSKHTHLLGSARLCLARKQGSKTVFLLGRHLLTFPRMSNSFSIQLKCLREEGSVSVQLQFFSFQSHSDSCSAPVTVFLRVWVDKLIKNEITTRMPALQASVLFFFLEISNILSLTNEFIHMLTANWPLDHLMYSMHKTTFQNMII